MRVALHAHSTWSYDGSWPLEKIARVFGRMGCDAVMMTEHDTGFDGARFGDYRAACERASTPRCQLIPGIEYSCPDNDVHLLTWGLDHYLAEHRPVMETLQRVRDAGGIAVFAHPVRRSAYRLFQPDWAPYLAAIELWNRKSDGVTWGKEAAELIARYDLPATVGMDFHTARQLYPLLNRFDIAPGADPETALVDAIRNGNHAPLAFGRPLLDATGAPRGRIHDRLETLRRGLRDLVRGKRA